MKIGPWYCAVLGSGETLDALEVSRTGAAAVASSATGASQWSRFEPSWNPWAADGSGGIYSVEKLPADYLATTIHADQPVTLTFELSRYEWFGGFAYRPPLSGAGVLVSDALIWLNGQQVELRNKLEGYERVPVAKRRGWHERFVWHDAVLVDLPLQPGENHLVVSLHKQERKSWFNSVRLFPQPAPALWSMIENDFPRSGNRLLEYVDARWFDAAAGWFPQGQSPQFERQLVEDLAQKLGPDGTAIRSRLDALVKAASHFDGCRLVGPLRRGGRASRGARPGDRAACSGRGTCRGLSARVSGRPAAWPDRRTEGHGFSRLAAWIPPKSRRRGC